VDWLRSWLTPSVSNQWVVVGLVGGLSILVLVSLLRAILYIRQFGLWNYLKTTFQIENETWRLIGILLLLAMAAAMVFAQWA
jgi:hypothetical protein